MRKLFISVVWLCAISLSAQTSSMPYHPFRRVDGKVYDLRARYQWEANWSQYDSKYDADQAKPYKSWMGDEWTTWKVLQVVDDGLLIEGEYKTLDLDGPPFYVTKHTEPFMLVNYPDQKTVVDNQVIHFLALKTGTYSYTSVGGGTKTITKCDYGIPFTPQPALPAEKTGTNSN
jgi:hypothetical protein